MPEDQDPAPEAPAVVHLATRTNDGTRWTPEDALQSALDDIRSGKRTPTKLAVVMLDDRGDRYNIHFTQAGMRMSEIVVLLDTMATRLKMTLLGLVR